MPNNQFWKVNSSLLVLQKIFYRIDGKLKDREVKIKREKEVLFFKPIIVSIDDMDNFEQKGMKKIRPVKNTWYDWLISYIPEHITKIVDGFKDEILNLFNSTHLKK